MSCDIFTDKFVSDVITGLQKCSDPLHVNCLECPWAHHPNGCRRVLEQGALIIIKHYRDKNGCLETELKKRVDELRKAEMEVKYHMARNDALDRELTRYKEQKQLLSKQPIFISEPVKIEEIDFAKVAKNADKATKACNNLVDALNELDRLRNKHGVIKK